MAALLDVRDLTVRFGGLFAVRDVDLTVDTGQCIGLIGANGAGKTTFIDALSGLVPYTGSVRLDGAPIDSLPTHARAQRGLTRTFQAIELFEDLTVRENLLVAAERPSALTVVSEVVSARQPRSGSIVTETLDVFGVGDMAERLPSQLSHGQRKLVGIARALAARPRLILLDEPAAGLDTNESRWLGEQLKKLPDLGISLLLVDHDMSLVLNACEYLYVLEFGSLIAQGLPDDVRQDKRVIASYLGDEIALARPDDGTSPTGEPGEAGDAGGDAGRTEPVIPAGDRNAAEKGE